MAVGNEASPRSVKVALEGMTATVRDRADLRPASADTLAQGPGVPKVTFPSAGSQQLARELKERVSAYFRDRGLSDKANALMILRTIVVLGVTFGAYALILTRWFSPASMLALAVLVGVGVAGIGFGVAHDAAHGAYSSRSIVNRTLAYTFDLCGASSHMWQLGHNVVHHTYTNIPGVDGDIASSGLLRQSPGRPPRWFHRYQHLYAFPLYSLATLNWAVLKDYRELSQSTLGPYLGRIHRRSDIVVLLGFKIVYYCWSFLLPFFILGIPWWQFLIGYAAMHLTAGLILGSVFPLAHVVEGAIFPMPDANGTMSDAWIAHELSTTADFSNGNRLLTWCIGSLNYQIEHHLFPRICSVHFPAIREIVRDAAHRHGLPYHHNPTLCAALRSHWRMLKRLGRPEPVAPYRLGGAPTTAS